MYLLKKKKINISNLNMIVITSKGNIIIYLKMRILNKEAN
jgi:hypothetical protein